MNGTQLAGRLLLNIKIGLKAQQLAHEIDQKYHENPKREKAIEEGWIKTICHISMPQKLDSLIELININECILEFDELKERNLSFFDALLAPEREKIAVSFQYILEYIKPEEDDDDEKKLNEILVGTLNHIDIEARRLQHCINVLKAED